MQKNAKNWEKWWKNLRILTNQESKKIKFYILDIRYEKKIWGLLSEKKHLFGFVGEEASWSMLESTFLPLFFIYKASRTRILNGAQERTKGAPKWALTGVSAHSGCPDPDCGIHYQETSLFCPE